jgi:hypothetical protein
MKTIGSGVIMRIGTYDTAVYPERTQREVHQARRDESISYRITQVDDSPNGILHRDESGWAHYVYRYVYRYLGKTFQVTLRTGVNYGEPKPLDGLVAAFRDAHWIDDQDSFPQWMADHGFRYPDDYRAATVNFDACSRVKTRLQDWFGNSDDYEIWDRILDESNTSATNKHYARAGVIS